MLMRKVGKDYNWNLNFVDIALMCCGGCIIRSVFLGKIKGAYTNNPELVNLLFGELLLLLRLSWVFLLLRFLRL
jgi:6-phosphogluconate dehydrogenase